MPRKKLTKDETISLVESFHELSVAMGNFRIKNLKNLTKTKNKELEGLQWTLFNISSDLNAESVLMKTALLDDSLKTLTQSTKAMKSAAGKINNIKQWIRIGSKAIAFGGAIASGHVGAMGSAGKELFDEIKNA